jgi:uncharacterized ubiquitin-like protein YukD
MSEENITLKIKMSMNNSTFEVTLPKTATVLELKESCKGSSSINPPEQNLVYRGRILADEKLLSDYNIANDHTIILVKKYTESKSNNLFNKNIF